MNLMDLRELINRTIDNSSEELLKISSFLFHNPETGLHEYKATELQCEFLRKNGFEVQKGLAGLDTSFIGSYQKGNGPCIAIFSEYDCLPDGLDHACGHNLIATAAMGTAIAVKEAMIKNGIQGTVKIIGAPDEEYTGGKIAMLKAGCFKEIDAAMAVHPTSAMSRVAGGCNAYQTYICEYFGKTVSSGNRPWDGVSAQDAVLLFFNALGYARQMLRDGVRVSAYVKDGMQNEGSISGHAYIGCDISAPNVFMIEEAATRIEKCFQCGAVGTGCTLQLKRTDSSKNRVPNSVLGELFRENCEFYGETMLPGMPDDNGGEDLGDVSHYIPAINPHLTILPERKISLHTEEFRNLVMTPAGENMYLLGAKTMAMTALQLMMNPSYIVEAKKELKYRLEELYGKDYEKMLNSSTSQNDKII